MAIAVAIKIPNRVWRQPRRWMLPVPSLARVFSAMPFRGWKRPAPHGAAANGREYCRNPEMKERGLFSQIARAKISFVRRFVSGPLDARGTRSSRGKEQKREAAQDLGSGQLLSLSKTAAWSGRSNCTPPT